jgi:hypothetical protein
MNHSLEQNVSFFQGAVAELRAFAAVLPPPLPDRCAPQLAALASGSFAHLAATLPRLLCDLLPVSGLLAESLGRAQLFGWWYVSTRDAVLDGQVPPEAILGGNLALLRCLALYGELGLPAAEAWAALQQAEARSAAAYAAELSSRLDAGPLTARRIAMWDEGLVAQRAATFLLGVRAQAWLAGFGAGDSRALAAEQGVTCLLTARQLTDDAGDWPDDLQAGRLNSVSAALAPRLLAGEVGLSRERLAAQLTMDESFWAEYWAGQQAQCEAGLATIEPFGPTQLAGLLRDELRRGEKSAEAGAEWRAEARTLLGVG